MGQSILRELLAEIRASVWFSILADEATDVSNNVQMSLSIGWVDRSFTIHEDVLGLIQLPDTKSVTIFHSIKLLDAPSHFLNVGGKPLTAQQT